MGGEDPVWSAVFDRVTLTFVGLVTVLVWFKAVRVLGPAAEPWLHRVDAALTVVLTIEYVIRLALARHDPALAVRRRP